MKSVKVLRLDSQKISNSEKKNVESRQANRKRMSGRDYMASLKKPRRVILTDHQEEQNMQTKPSHYNDSYWSGKSDGGNDNINRRKEFKIEDIMKASEANSRSSSTGTKSVVETLDHNNAAESSFAMRKNISGKEASGHEAGIGCITMTSPNNRRGGCIDLESDRETTLVTKKRESADTDFDNSAVIGKISDTSTTNLPSSSFGLQSHLVETCTVCFKRQRINNDSMNPGFCSCTKLIMLSLAFIDVVGLFVPWMIWIF